MDVMGSIGRVSKRTKSNADFANNFDYLRSLTVLGKRRKSLTNTLHRNKSKLLEVNAVEDDPNLWHTFKVPPSKTEYDLEQKIDLEIKMREGTTKLLAASHHLSQSLEAAKSLLTSNERMSVYLEELQRRKSLNRHENEPCRDDGVCSFQEPENEPRKREACPCKAKVCVSDIRMPLIWKEGDHFKNKGDYRRFAVFCLLRIGTEVYDTNMINRVDRSMTDLTFEDVVTFNNVPHNFEFRLEVYSHILQDDLSIASTPRKIRHRINDSLSRTVGRKLAASVRDELNAAAEIGPKFELVAQSTLTLENVDDNISTHDLLLVNNENAHSQLPLFGHFCCRLAALPEFLNEDCFSGPVKVYSENDKNFLQMWAVLSAANLTLWSSSERTAAPEHCIQINKSTKIETNESKQDVVISNAFNGVQTKHHLVIGNLEQWLVAIDGAIDSQVAWEHAATMVMKIHSAEVKKLPFFTIPRKTSLYDQTSLKDSPVAVLPVGENWSSSGSTSPPVLRSRSSSFISSSSSNSSFNRRSLQPRQRVGLYQRFSCQETSV